MSYAEISELCRSSSTPNSTILKRLADGLRQRSEIAKTKSSQHDVSFREYEKRKEKEVERHHEQEAAREREEEALRAEEKRVSPKKEVEDEEEDDEDERPLAVGARGLARQDGAPSEGLFSLPPLDCFGSSPALLSVLHPVETGAPTAFPLGILLALPGSSESILHRRSWDYWTIKMRDWPGSRNVFITTAQAQWTGRKD